MTAHHHLYRRPLAVSAAVLLAAGLAACGSSSKSSNGANTTGATSGASGASSGSTAAAGASGGGGNLSGTIRIYDIQDASGAAGAVGVDDENGSNLAVKDINAQHFLGNATLKISYADTGTSPTSAANLATQATTHHYPIVIGPATSSTAQAVAPILARAKQPTIFTQAGSSGILDGPAIFRLTTLQTDLYPTTLKWLQSKGVKTVAAVTASDIPTEVQLTNLIKTEGAADGLKLVGDSSILATQSNISAEVSKALSYHPDALALNVLLTQNATAASLIKQAGFTGPVVAEEAAGNGSLTGAGAAGNGIVWATDWVPLYNNAASKAFTTAYEAAYHKTPSDWAAESYDAVWFAARGLKQAGTTKAAGVTSALSSVGQQGFPALVGTAKVINGQEQSTPLLVQWQDGKAVPLPNQNP